ncbi:hypothetical protein LA080_006547 [Diaporthe eres]|nr:hypothetical protein LA080_006547 [Diaporthe eres]
MHSSELTGRDARQGGATPRCTMARLPGKRPESQNTLCNSRDLGGAVDIIPLCDSLRADARSVENRFQTDRIQLNPVAAYSKVHVSIKHSQNNYESHFVATRQLSMSEESEWLSAGTTSSSHVTVPNVLGYAYSVIRDGHLLPNVIFRPRMDELYVS